MNDQILEREPMNNEPEREPTDRARARLEALIKANAAPRCGARSKRTGKPCRRAAICNGRRSSWPPVGYRSAGRRTGRRVSTRCRATRYARCGAFSANRDRPPTSFMTERDGPMTPKAFHALFGRIGERAKMPFPVHPHMLRHGCGYALANAGHDTRALQAWLGHKNIQHTVRYTELAPDRFKNFWP